MINIDDARNPVDREFRRVLKEFLNAPKECVRTVRWRSSRNHSDYQVCQLPVLHALTPSVRARLVLQSHLYFEPRKYMFALLYSRTRVLSLDVGPRRSHTNLLNKRTVKSSHWSYYPCTEVMPDERLMNHREWLDIFFQKCNISFRGSYYRPPHDKEQLRLPL